MSLNWIRQEVAKQRTGHRPFFAYIAVTAPHLPCEPPSWYCPGGCPSVWPNTRPYKPGYPSWFAQCANVTSPRLPNFDRVGPDFHSGIASQAPFDDLALRYVDKLAIMRCLTLLAVDDTVAELHEAVEKELKIADRTFFIFTSDHGYNMGHHRLPDNKFNSYLHDLRIPLLIKGPGIAPQRELTEIVTQVDMAPTLLGLAGIPTPAQMDGRSMVPLLMAKAITVADAAVPSTVVAHVQEQASSRPQPWRQHSLSAWYMCGFGMLNHTEDDASNTFIAMFLNHTEYGHWKYAEFEPTGVPAFPSYPPCKIYTMFIDMTYKRILQGEKRLCRQAVRLC
jgi:N-acetylglucosamine-6-sulfatase